ERAAAGQVLSARPERVAAQPVRGGHAVAQRRRAGVQHPDHATFRGGTMIRASFNTPVIQASEESSGSRTITGRAGPWNTEGTVSDGSRVRFLPGSLDAAARPVVLLGHDSTRAIGRVTAASDTSDGMDTTVSVSRTRDGDEALVLAADGV